MWRAVVAAGLLIGFGLSDSMADPCFEVIASAGQTTSPSFILVDRCTGKTWMLVRLVLTDPQGNLSASQYNYRWLPLTGGPKEEAPAKP